MLDSDPEDEPVPPPTLAPRPPSPSPSPSPPRALPPLTPEPPGEAPAPQPKPSWGALMSGMRPDAPRRPAKRPKPAAKPAQTPPKKKPDPVPARAGWLPRDEWLASRARQGAEPNGFDVRVHGYWLTRSRGLVYRCPDGRELPATGVDAFKT